MVAVCQTSETSRHFCKLKMKGGIVNACRLIVVLELLRSISLASSFPIRLSTFLSPQRSKRSSCLAVTPESLVLEAANKFQTVLSLLDPLDRPVTTVLGSYALVTASDMIPFVPCQPLAVALGAKLGFGLAFPITCAGQTTAGILAFSAARRVADSDRVQAQLQQLDADTLEQFQALQRYTSEEEQDRKTIFLGLMGLRLAPFFPFSAGNYLLGAATAVPLSLFGIATVFGCVLSNFLSTSVGAGGALWFQQQAIPTSLEIFTAVL